MTIALRRVRPADSGLLLDWVNQPDSLAGKLRTSGPIAREQHEAWFASRLADPETFLWIIESVQRPVGQLRLMKAEGVYEVDIFVVPDQRQSGVARQALAEGLRNLARARKGAQMIRARVKPDNVRSQRLFLRAGFVLVARNSDHLVYDLTTS
jgi:RimJ/RimL family protein N-acetyltransferase